MSSTSQKHGNFVAGPMGDKPVAVLAGIGPVLGKRLKHRDFDKAYMVLGKFLVLKKNEELFKDWLKDVTCPIPNEADNVKCANSKQANECFTCLKEWCDAFL